MAEHGVKALTLRSGIGELRYRYSRPTRRPAARPPARGVLTSRPISTGAGGLESTPARPSLWYLKLAQGLAA